MSPSFPPNRFLSPVGPHEFASFKTLGSSEPDCSMQISRGLFSSLLHRRNFLLWACLSDPLAVSPVPLLTDSSCFCSQAPHPSVPEPIDLGSGRGREGYTSDQRFSAGDVDSGTLEMSADISVSQLGGCALSLEGGGQGGCSAFFSTQGRPQHRGSWPKCRQRWPRD